MKAKLIIFLLSITSTFSLFCQFDPTGFADKLSREYEVSKNDSVKIDKLFNQAFFYYDYMGQDKYADSISQIAIQIAQFSHRPELLLLAYNKYIESNNLDEYYQKALGYALMAEQLAITSNNSLTIFNTYNNIVAVYLSGYEYDKALEYSYKSLSYTANTDNNSLKVESYLNISRSLDGKNQKIEAFRNNLNAFSLAERLNNKRLLIKCCAQLSKYYDMSKLYVKAIHYKLMQRDLLKKITPVDSVALMWVEYDLQDIDINSNNNKLNEKGAQQVLDFARRWKHQRMQNYEFALIRKHLIEADKMEQLRDLYYKNYPAELQKIETNNPGLYNRLKAFFCEYENKPDSALYYFNKAEIILQSDPNKILKSNFYFRFGQFLKRQEQKSLAIEKFSKSYNLAKEAGFFDYMIKSSKELESLYVSKSDYKNAYTYSLLNEALADSLNNASKKDQMLVMEIDHETLQRSQAEEQLRQATSKRYYLQYSAMIIFIIGVFIVLLLLGSLKVPVWIIKMLGFFAFILLFEFIIMLADHWIHDITHGEPWKILLIKIFLIALLLPFHHWVEKKVIAFLLHPNMINIFQYPIKEKLRAKIKGLAGK